MQCRLGLALGGQLINYFSKKTTKTFPSWQPGHQEHSPWSEVGDILCAVVTTVEDAPKPR